MASEHAQPEVITIPQLEDSARDVARLLDMRLAAHHGQRVGFTIFLFEFGDGGNFTYLSNAQRADMVNVVKEWLAREENRA